MEIRRFFMILLAIGVIFSACTSGEDADEEIVQPTETVLAEEPLFLWLPPYLPEQLSSNLNLPEGFEFAASEQNASLKIDVGSDALVSRWIFALVAPFPTIPDEVSSGSLKAFWQGAGVSAFPARKLVVDGKTKALFEKLWGAASNANVFVASSNDIQATAWEERSTWALIPFELLEPRWKVIRIDGQSPTQKNLDPVNYPLTIPLSVVGESENVAGFLKENNSPENQILPPSNRDESKLANVIVTGVTALVRATAHMMEVNGMTYPSIDIGDLLRSADILHISNEIPFTETCPNPFYQPENDANLVFCSKPRYIELLEAIGTDVVELTGDHFRDWGPDAMLNTISMYEERGWQYYGGGRDLEDAMQPALFEVNGNKIAFLGCNAKPAGYSTASSNNPGALNCDMQAMGKAIAAVVRNGYLPIFTFQHLEYYAYNANENLVDDFHAAADAGAVIVSGSQAHQPHALEFYKDALLHYGLGNLFFDQYNEGAAMRQAFIDEHIFYDGRYISTNLITIQFIDFARSRFMTYDERVELLDKVFTASKW